MLNSLRRISILFFIFLSVPALAQVPTTGDCLGAIPICNTTYSFGSSPNGEGNYPNEINSGPSCMDSGELNDAWFIFTVQTSGQVRFLITPNNSSDDYDWAVYNLTNNNCSDIYGSPGLEVSCNWSDQTGTTGPNGGSGSTSQGALGSPYNAGINVTAGQTYVINVSNFSSTTSGYSIDFGGSTATIFDAVPPSIQSVTTPTCGATTVTFNFNENVRCNTIQASDFTFTGPGGPYAITGISGAACTAGGLMENTYTLTVSPAITSSGTYTISLVGSVTDNCGNAAPAGNLTFTINSVAAPSASGTTICATSSTTLNASGSTGSYQWYDASSGGTLLGSSASYTTPLLSTTTTYYVQAMSGICSSTRVPVTVTVNPTPAAPTAAGTTICSNNSVILTATAPGGTYAWYTASTGGSLLQTGASYTTVNLFTTTTYYVQTTSSGCTSSRTPVTVTVNPTPAAPTAAGTTICSNNSVTLNATAPGGTYEWYTASSGGSLLQTGASYTTPSLSTTTTYYVQTTTSGCVSSRTPVTVTVNPTPAAPTAASTSICSGNSTTLNATAPGGSYAWYDASTGGTLLQSGTSYTTPTLTSTTTYYVQTTSSGCTSARTPVTVTVNPQDNPAFSYTGSPFCQTGSNPSPAISGTAGGTFTAGAGLSINASTGQINLTGSSTGTYNVTYTTSGVCPNSQVQSITISTAPSATFSYSGPYCVNGTNPSPTFGAGASAGTFSSGAGLVFINPSTGQVNLSASAPGTYTVTNNIAASGGCASASANNSITINAAPAANAGMGQTICAGQTVSVGGTAVGGSNYSWSSNPAGFSSATANPSVTPSSTTIYTVTETNSAGCSANNSVTVSVNPTPVAPTAAPQSVCSGSSTMLTATAPGGTYEWYDASTGGTLLGSGASYTTPSLTSNTTYYVQSISGTCIGPRTAVTVTVNPLPTANAGNDATICSGTSTTLTAGGGVNYSWSPSTGLSDPNAASTSSNPSGTTTYTVTVSSAANCTATDEVIVNVNAAPTATITGITNICSGNSATLSAAGSTAGSGTISSYQWMESGNPITGASSSTYTVSTVGNFSVTVTNSNGCSTTSAVTSVSILNSPTAVISGSSSFCPGDSVSLSGLGSTAGSGAITTYEWVLNGSVINAGSATYASSAGNYVLVVTDNNSCMDSSSAFTVTVNPLPDPSFSGLNSAYCVSASAVTLTPVLSGGTFNGTGVSGSNFIPGNAGVGGPYDIEYIVTDANGCIDSSTVQVIVNALPDATFTGLLASYCVNNPAAVLSATTGGGVYSGQGVSGSGFDPATAGIGGPYTITYVVSNAFGCVDSTSQQVQVNGLPDPSFSGLASAYCVSGSAVTMTPFTAGGMFSGSGVSGSSFDPATAGVGGPYSIQYAVTDANGCRDSVSQQVTVNALPDAGFSGLTSTGYCVSATVASLTANDPLGVFSGNGVSGNSFDPATAGAGGPYTISCSVTDANGCFNSSTQQVIVHSLPVIDKTTVSVDSADCGTNTGAISGIVASGNSPFTFIWMDTNSDTISSGASPSVTGLGVGTYYLTAIDANGCATTAAGDTIFMRPGVFADFTASVDSGRAPLWVSFTNNCVGATSYNWTFGENESNSVNFTPGNLYTEKGQFEVILIATNATGCSDTATVMISVTEDTGLNIPNVFSPNADGHNDVFEFNTSGLKELNCVIFNRWGERVYEWNTVNSGWDGKTLSGIEAADGVYYFLLTAEGKDNAKVKKEGTVTLVR